MEAGKHVYVEKPLSVKFEEGRELVELAKAKGLRIGNAPDTFLGGGIQTCIKLLSDGWIGEPGWLFGLYDVVGCRNVASQPHFLL